MSDPFSNKELSKIVLPGDREFNVPLRAPLKGSIYESGTVHGKLHIPGVTPDPKKPVGLLETSEYSRVSFPFRVEMWVKMSDLEEEHHKRVYYVRAPDWGDACATAAAIWCQWERVGMGIPKEQRYPMINAKMVAEVLDENDYQNAWAAARRHHCLAKGDKRNPAIFTCLDEDRAIRRYYGNEYISKPPQAEIDMTEGVL